MSILSPIRRLARHIHRMRLEMAEQDLAFLEARAPVVIGEQRCRVAELRIKLGMHRIDPNTATIARRIEHRLKAPLLS